MIRLGHIVNPVAVGPTSDLYLAQPITFETMRRAKAYAEHEVNVTLYTTQYAGDRAIIPDDFTILPDLERSALDGGPFKIPRQLPLISDILDRLYEASDADYFIYTNVDISLMPHFYQAVGALLESGIDGIVINRRTIPSTFAGPHELPLMYAELGQNHKGYDCFVFRRSAYPHFELGKVYVGIPWIGQVLVWNTLLHSERFLHLKQSHFTFHLGNDQAWQADRYDDYRQHNMQEARQILDALEVRHEQLYSRPDLSEYLELMFPPKGLKRILRANRRFARHLNAFIQRWTSTPS